MAAELEVKNISLDYGAVRALFDVSFAASKGKVTTVMGRNGVGKSSLARAITGREPIASGDILEAGQSIGKLSPAIRAHKGIAYVPQGREIFPLLSVQENLETGFSGLPRSERYVPEQVFELFPVLKDMLSRRGGDLSGGQQQQLAIGRALVMRPKVLVLDEPTEGIQPNVIQDIGRAISALRESAEMSIILIEQYFEFAWTLADEVIVMDRGRIIVNDKKSELKADDVQSLLTV